MIELVSACWLISTISLLIFHHKQRKLDLKKYHDLKLEVELMRTKQQSYELVDFLADIKTHGYSVLRINPDAVFLRGKR